jgi:hypothetical protein
MALEALGVALWLGFAGLGAWLLLTGRNFFFGIPLGLEDVRLRRLLGLFCVLVAGFFILRISQGSFSPWSVIGLYLGLGFSAVIGWRNSRGART